MKIFRKIIALSLVFVLFFLCEANAASVSMPINKKCGNSQYEVNASITIDSNSTNGTTYLTDNGMLIPSSYLSISVTYRYIKMVGVNPVAMTYTKTGTTTNLYEASVFFSDTSIREMVNATYTCAADIPYSYGTQRYQTNSYTIAYIP